MGHLFEDVDQSLEAEFARSRQLRRTAVAVLWRSREACHGLNEIVEASRRLRETTRAEREARARQNTVNPPLDPASALRGALANAGFSEGDLDEITDDLIAAHRLAVTRDDTEVEAMLRPALMAIGCHLASRTGPRAAGVMLN